VNAKPDPVVFMLWGSYAQKKAAFVDSSKHLVLEAAHPSPLSAHGGFFGCRHFSKANMFLKSRGLEPVDWALPEP
jgi:uracil-DNA glycosylase